MVAYKCIWVSLRILDDAKTKRKNSKQKTFFFFFFTEAKLYCNPLTRIDILLLNSKNNYSLATCKRQRTWPCHLTRYTSRASPCTRSVQLPRLPSAQPHGKTEIVAVPDTLQEILALYTLPTMLGTLDLAMLGTPKTILRTH